MYSSPDTTSLSFRGLRAEDLRGAGLETLGIVIVLDIVVHVETRAALAEWNVSKVAVCRLATVFAPLIIVGHGTISPESMSAACLICSSQLALVSTSTAA